MDMDVFKCLGKVKVAGPNPAQGFFFRSKVSQIEGIEEQPIDNTAILNSVRIFANFSKVRTEKRPGLIQVLPRQKLL